MSNATFMETAKCPEGHEFKIRRRAQNAGKIVYTDCKVCGVNYAAQVAGAPLRALTELAHGQPTRESHIEDRLVKRAKELGGEVRKVSWIGRKGAPDRLVMLPPKYDSSLVQSYMAGDPDFEGRTIWVELKAPGKAAGFPRTAHERAQHREHERMRKMGQRVEVVDSYERIEEILAC